ncbi:class I SAM-dependent methyltransferase [Brevundimonas sp.]|uniref:class I SAM-dependent methyltransferase n=1 Tax=Brevundimonas sp. TaxID=1871086 RepID=UPI002ED97CF1
MTGSDAGEGHWRKVYRETGADAVSWYEAEPSASLEALARAGVSGARSFVDVGGGASRLVDQLLDRGWSDLTVVDIASEALAVSQQRLGERAHGVNWLAVDISAWTPSRSFQIWHDRAVFHFMTEPEQRAGYKTALRLGTREGSLAIFATFALTGPERCSGLPVRRYDARALAAEFSDHFELLDSWQDDHVTPSGRVQPFLWSVLKRSA